MDINLYKVTTELSLNEIKSYFIEKNYQAHQDSYEYNGSKISFLYEETVRNNPDWFNFVNEKFPLRVDFGNNLNALLLIQLPTNILYIVPFGRSYSRLDANVIDFQFGMNFAEKQLEDKNIIGKKIDYYLQNKIREISQLTDNWIESATPNQSYSMVRGKPRDSHLFGETISCSNQVNFKLYGDTNIEIFQNLINLIFNVNQTLNAPLINPNIPRIKLLNEQDDSLFEKLEESIIKSKSNYTINFTSLLERNNDYIFLNFEDLSLYNKKISEENILPINDIKELISLIKDGTCKFKDIRVKYYSSIDEKHIKDYLVKFLDITIQLEYKHYLFTNKKWHYLNKTFLDLLHEQIDNISLCKDDNLKIHETVKNEDQYIDLISKKDNFIELHKKNVTGLTTPVEIADLYHNEKKEFFAVKFGLEASQTVYSLNQSMLAMTILRSKDEYNYRNLLDSVESIEELKKVNKYSILWVLLDHEDTSKSTSKMYLTALKNNDLKLSTIQSLHIKLKISEWYSVAKQLEYEPSIYFTKVNKISDIKDNKD